MTRTRSTGAKPIAHARKATRRPGVLTWLAILLCVSGAIRLGGQADMAFAIGSEAEPSADPPPAGLTDSGASAGSLLEAFQQREERLIARETALREREQALAVVSAEVEAQLAALEAAETSLAALMALSEAAAAEDLARLTAVYENMRPRDAAALFEAMEPGFAAGFLGMMQPASAAAIMSELSPSAGYSISAVLAGRNAGTPTE